MNPEMMSMGGGGGSSYSLASEAGGNDTFGSTGPSFGNTVINNGGSGFSLQSPVVLGALVLVAIMLLGRK
jgi:hypothetical protein